MVIMISATGRRPARRLRWQSGASANPTPVVTTMAMSAANGSGTPASAMKTVVMPPSMTNSPWAKLMMSDAL